MKIQNNNVAAIAEVKGSAEYPGLYGYISFYKTDRGVVVTASVNGLPYNGECSPGVFGLHIHSGGSCTGNAADPFADAGNHYNPDGCPHPYHAGDLPPLFGNHGYAWMSVLTDRFTLEEIIGRVVVIHENPDDFTTQPAGNSGKKIACGKIVCQMCMIK